MVLILRIATCILVAASIDWFGSDCFDETPKSAKPQNLDIGEQLPFGDKAAATHLEKDAKTPERGVRWSLSSGDNREVGSESFEGAPLLLIFHRGIECEHCAEQIRLISQHQKDFERLGIQIVAISPTLPQEEKLKSLVRKWEIQFPVLKDPKMAVFEAFHSKRGDDPLHGVFIIDSNGKTLWGSVSNSAELDIQRILRLCDSLTRSSR